MEISETLASSSFRAEKQRAREQGHTWSCRSNVGCGRGREGWTQQNVEVVWGWWISKKRCCFVVLNRSEKWRTMSNQEPCKAVSSKSALNTGHALTKQNGSLLLGKCRQTCCGTAVFLVKCSVWMSSSHQCCHGGKSQTPLAGLQITWQSHTPNCAYCPCRFSDVVSKKAAQAVLSRSSHWHFYPITVTHTLKEPKHEAKGHHKNSNSFSLFCNCLLLLYLTVIPHWVFSP